MISKWLRKPWSGSKRIIYRLVLCLVLAIALSSVPLVVSASTNVSISDVTISPTQPQPGETVTFTPVVRNLQSSTDPLSIEGVAIRGVGTNEYDRVNGLGSLGPGSSREVTLTTEFDQPGTKSLRVILYSHPVGNPTDTKTIEFPLTFTVQDNDPQIGIETDDAVAGVTSNGTVTVVNGLDTEVTSVEVTIDGSGVTTIDDRSLVATLGSGQSAEAGFKFRPDAAGRHDLTATVNYTVGGTTRRTTTYTTSIEAASLDEDVQIDVTGVGAGLTAKISNLGNHEIENVNLTASSDGETFDQKYVESVPRGESTEAPLDVSPAQLSGNVTVTADYEMGVRESTASKTVDTDESLGLLELTGIDVSREDGRYRISGSTSNVGMTEVNSLIVSVRDTHDVDPASPNKQYFVGTVPESDFVSFDVYARVSPGVSTIPINVTYRVDGDMVTQSFAVETTSTSMEQTPSGGDTEKSSAGLGSGLVVGTGILVTLAVSSLIALGWRRANHGDS